MQFDLLISTRNLGHAQYEQLNYSSSLLQRIINGWVLCDSEGIGLLVSSKHTPSQSPNSYQVAAPATNYMVTWASVEIAKKLLKSETNHISTGLTSNIVYNTMFHHIQYHYYWKGKLKLIITDEVTENQSSFQSSHEETQVVCPIKMPDMWYSPDHYTKFPQQVWYHVANPLSQV